jgi:hypothetical protein
MQRLFNWLARKISPDKAAPKRALRRTGDKRMPPSQPAPKPVRQPRPKTKPVGYAAEVGGKIEDGGPGKNVLVRNKYVREDTSTHETLTIIDDSLAEANEDDGLDPYNTGRFDSSKTWGSSRSRK